MLPFLEATVLRFSAKYMFLKNVRNSQENTCGGVSVSIMLQASRL